MINCCSRFCQIWSNAAKVIHAPNSQKGLAVYVRVYISFSVWTSLNIFVQYTIYIFTAVIRYTRSVWYLCMCDVVYRSCWFVHVYTHFWSILKMCKMQRNIKISKVQQWHLIHVNTQLYLKFPKKFKPDDI